MATPNLDGDIFEIDYGYRSSSNMIRLAAVTLYINMLGFECPNCSCKKHSVESFFNSAIYYVKCIKCGQRRTMDIVFDKEKAPDVQRNR